MEQGPERTSLAAVVRALREAKGMTQTALEQASGVPQRTISRVEGARKEGYLPQPHILKGLARGLGVSVKDLLLAAGYDVDGDSNDDGSDIDFTDPFLLFWASYSEDLDPHDKQILQDLGRTLASKKKGDDVGDRG